MRGFIYIRKLLVAILFLSSLCSAQTDDSDVEEFKPTAGEFSLERMIDPNFSMNDRWNDGKSEVATYKASSIIYGEDTSHTLTISTSYEEFNREYYSKADWPYGQKPLLPVLKQTMVAAIPTTDKPYAVASAVYVERTKFWKLVKLTTSTQEWSGITSKQFEMWHDTPKEKYFSYWDDEGSGERAISASTDIFFEEQLLLIFRGLSFDQLPSGAFRLYRNQTSNHAPVPTASPASFEVRDTGDTWTVDVFAKDDRSMSIVYLKEFPHVLKEFHHSDGREMELVSVDRRLFWDSKE